MPMMIAIISLSFSPGDELVKSATKVVSVQSLINVCVFSWMGKRWCSQGIIDKGNTTLFEIDNNQSLKISTAK
jgi:hypothetical protein